jgi:hypothetical protein
MPTAAAPAHPRVRDQHLLDPVRVGERATV